MGGAATEAIASGTAEMVQETVQETTVEMTEEGATTAEVMLGVVVEKHENEAEDY